MGFFDWLFGSSTQAPAPAPTPAPAPAPAAADEPLPAAEDFVVWSAAPSGDPTRVAWKKFDGVFSSEDEAYEQAAEIASGGHVLEVRVLRVSRPAPPSDSPILAGRVAEAPQVPGIQKAQKFTFDRRGLVTFESGSEVREYRYTIDGGELWIVWEFAGRLSDQVYRFTPVGFNIHRALERGGAEWYLFTDLEPNHIYRYTN